MADGDEVVIPYQPGKGPDASAATATAAPDTGAALETTSPSVPSRLPEQPIQNMTDPEAALKFDSWGSKVYHGILNALGGAYSTQFIPTPNGVIQNQVKNTPGQQWKNIISGALSGFSSAAAAQGTGPGSTMRAAGAGVAGGYKQRVQQDEDQREAAMKMATTNAQTAYMSAQIAESTWRVANSQRQASDEIITGANTFNQLVSAGGPGSTDLGTMTWQDAQKAAKEWPQLHHEQAGGRIITMQDVDPEGKTTGKVRAAWVTNDWLNAKTTQDYKFTVPLPGKDGKTEYQTFTIPAGAYTQGDMSKLIMAQGSEWGKQQLEQARLDLEKERVQKETKLEEQRIALERERVNKGEEGSWQLGEDKDGKSVFWNTKSGDVKDAEGVKKSGSYAKEHAADASESQAYTYAKGYLDSGAFTGPGDEALQEKFFELARPKVGFRMSQPQIQMLQDSQDWINKMKAKGQHLKGGQWFSDEQRKQIVDTMGQLYAARTHSIEEGSGLKPAAQPQAPGAATGAAQPPAGMVTVQIPGQAPGHIPAAALEQFKRDHPNATVPQ